MSGKGVGWVWGVWMGGIGEDMMAGENQMYLKQQNLQHWMGTLVREVSGQCR